MFVDYELFYCQFSIYKLIFKFYYKVYAHIFDISSVTVTVLDDSETSVHQTNSPSKSFSTELRVSKPRSNILQTIRDSFDLDESEESVVSHHSSSNNQLSIFHKSLLNDESAVNEIERSTSNLHIEYGHDELKAQLLKRCGQTNVLAFNETYSARYIF